VNFRLFTKKYEKLFATYKKKIEIELSLGNLYFEPECVKNQKICSKRDRVHFATRRGNFFIIFFGKTKFEL